ncbi:hypothetical protein WJX73_009463 [Symbiochloris irregularis]|uniref:Nicotinate-nucleotide adenylyltransferase n=1 Tax=Symbiochloris irregularis TaxID=706552 RepID=A0AAW1PTC0_9CHLO
MESRPLVPGRGSLRTRAQDQDAEQTYKRTAEKALEVNLNPLWYGTFAEIGAGQEVARWFFRVGAAAGTIAKSVSAYDMTISDSMYGASERYVTRERVAAMLDYEYLQCDLTLRKQRGADTAFFAFSDTVVAKAFGRDNECHGWLGIKYQDSPRSQPSSIMIHIRMLDSTAQLQQEALGVLGVNFIHAALTMGSDTSKIISSLFSDLTRSRMQVDLIDFSGPAFKDTDNRVAALRLVQLGLTDAALFDPAGAPRIPMEVLYKKNVLLTRGRFRPFTSLHNDMLMGAASQYFCEGQEEEEVVSLQNDECVFREDTIVLLEMTTRDMMEGGDLLDWTSDKGIQEDAFLQRIEALSTMGYSVMISSFRRFFALAAYISTFTRQSIVLAMGIPSLARLFDENFYSDLNGGILEGFGRLLRFNLKIYVYPTLDEKTGQLITAKNCKVEPSVQLLYDYILSRGTIVSINDFDERLLRHGDHL